MLRCAVWIENPEDERLQRNARKRPEPKKRHDETAQQRDERIKREYLQAAAVLPLMDDGTLADYVKSMDQAGLTPAAVAMGVAAVKWGWKNLLRAGTIDWRTRGLDWTLTAAAMKRVRRDSEVQRRGQVKGLTWEEVDEIVKRTTSGGSIHGLRDAALILLMSDCLLRVSEAVAVNVEDFEENSLTVKRSKNRPNGRNSNAVYRGSDKVARQQVFKASRDHKRCGLCAVQDNEGGAPSHRRSFNRQIGPRHHQGQGETCRC